jgi:hypothetical protein
VYTWLVGWLDGLIMFFYFFYFLYDKGTGNTGRGAYSEFEFLGVSSVFFFFGGVVACFVFVLSTYVLRVFFSLVFEVFEMLSREMPFYLVPT